MKLPDGTAAFWDFTEPKPPYISHVHGERLRLERGSAARRTSGPWGGGVYLNGASNLYIPPAECGNLNMAASQAVTVIAWAKRSNTEDKAWCIAGMWDEWGKKRQYALFHDLGLVGGQNRPYFHVSRLGGATPGFEKFSVDGAATLRTTTMTGVGLKCVGGTYDGEYARAYLHGLTDRYEDVKIVLKRKDGSRFTSDRNPYHYPDGLNLYPNGPATFRVNRSTPTGGTVPCTIGGLLIVRRALSDEEMLAVHETAGG